MAGYGSVLTLELVLYLSSPLLVPVAFAVIGLTGEAVARALGRPAKA